MRPKTFTYRRLIISVVNFGYRVEVVETCSSGNTTNREEIVNSSTSQARMAESPYEYFDHATQAWVQAEYDAILELRRLFIERNRKAVRVRRAGEACSTRKVVSYATL